MFSDIHGCVTPLIEALHEAGFEMLNPNHILVGVGDYFDRGDENKEVYNFLKGFPKERKYLTFGNHDSFLLDYLQGLDGFFNAEYNGLWHTIAHLAEQNLSQWQVLRDMDKLRFVINNKQPELIEFLKSMSIGFKLDEYIITHAGFKPEHHIGFYNKGEVPTFFPDFWANTPEFIRQTRKLFEDVKFIVGHWHAFRLNGDFNQIKDKEESNTFFYRNYIGIDACTNYTGRVNIYTIETDSLPIAFGPKHTLEEIIKM